ILEWCSRLEEGVAAGRRSLFTVWSGCSVAGIAITKKGSSAKLCHISVSPSVRDRGVGRSLMQLALADIAPSGARTMRVTTSEEVFRNHGAFFRAAGFKAIDWQIHRYRRGVSEIVWQIDVARSPGTSEYFEVEGVEAPSKPARACALPVRLKER